MLIRLESVLVILLNHIVPEGKFNVDFEYACLYIGGVGVFRDGLWPLFFTLTNESLSHPVHKKTPIFLRKLEGEGLSWLLFLKVALNGILDHPFLIEDCYFLTTYNLF